MAKYYSAKKSVFPYNRAVAVTFENEPFDGLRARILQRIKERDLTLAEISKKIGRNHAYMHQYIFRGSPQKLDEADRPVIARILGMAETDLGGPDTPQRAETEASADVGSLTESQLRAALGPFLAALRIDRELWGLIARGLLRAIKAAQSLDPHDLRDRDYEVASRLVVQELLPEAPEAKRK